MIYFLYFLCFPAVVVIEIFYLIKIILFKIKSDNHPIIFYFKNIPRKEK
jgi:hypothetical protein